MSLLESDVRHMLQLVTDAGAMTATGSVRQAFLRGIANLTGSTVALEVHGVTAYPQSPVRIHSIYSAGPLANYADLLTLSTVTNQTVDPKCSPLTLVRSIESVLARLPDLAELQIDVGRIDLSSQFPGLAGLSRLIGSVRRRSLHHQYDCVNLLAVGSPDTSLPWTNRDRLIVRLMHESFERLTTSRESAQSDNPLSLPPHLRRLIPELLGGASEKQIARALGYTFNTTHQYIKRLYRRFGVTSRAEFMATIHSRFGQPNSSASRVNDS